MSVDGVPSSVDIVAVLELSLAPASVMRGGRLVSVLELVMTVTLGGSLGDMFDELAPLL